MFAEHLRLKIGWVFKLVVCYLTPSLQSRAENDRLKWSHKDVLHCWVNSSHLRSFAIWRPWHWSSIFKILFLHANKRKRHFCCNIIQTRALIYRNVATCYFCIWQRKENEKHYANIYCSLHISGLLKIFTRRITLKYRVIIKEMMVYDMLFLRSS
jgi:hypothetical protein